MIQLRYFKFKYSGFTLIEIMIVIAILAILSSIAVPLYNAQSRKKNRVVAISSLLQARAQLEKCYLNSQNYVYDGCSLDPNKSLDKKNLYQISIIPDLATSNNVTTYTLTANNLNVKPDLECFGYTLTNLGIKGNQGTGALQRCWAQ